MNDHDLEQFLARRPMRGIPAHWRSQILETAALATVPDADMDHVTAISWWRALWLPSPLAWSAVGCAWVVIVAMSLAARPSRESHSTRLSLAAAQGVLNVIHREQHMARQLILVELPPSPPPAPTPSGAYITPFREGEVPFA